MGQYQKCMKMVNIQLLFFALCMYVCMYVRYSSNVTLHSLKPYWHIGFLTATHTCCSLSLVLKLATENHTTLSLG